MRPLRLPTLTLLAVLAAVGCENPVATFQSPTSLTRSVTTQATLDAEIRALVRAGFPAGQATAILANWDQVVRTAAATPKVTLKGKIVPGSRGRTALTRTLNFLQVRTSAATPPAGETAEHLVARIALDMSLYVYGGPDTPVPAITPDADVAFEVVSPTSTDTVVTPALQAAVVFPAGAVSEPTVVVITPDDVYWPANCSGPLDTQLCQYPRFYHFNVFPDVKLATPAKVQVCHVDAGNNRLPLADHDRFRIAHEKPASPSDYSAGSTIVDNVEILAYTPLTVTNCSADGGTQYTPPPLAQNDMFGRVGTFAMGMARRARTAAVSLLTPRDAFAIDVGGGGLVEIFSVFGVVDPVSQPDLAQSTASGTYFAPLMTTIVQGDPFPTTSWHVNNVGSGTSGAFTSSVILATDSALTNVVTSVPLGGAPALVPGSFFAYPAQTIPTSPSLTPGTYFIGTRVTPVGPDSASDDDWRSYRVTVNPALAAAADVGIVPGFTVSAASVVQGNSIGTNAFTVTNYGAATSDTFAVRMVLATDTLLTATQWANVLSGTTMLTGGGHYPFPAATVAISPCQAPGTYFLGPRIDPVSPDVNPSNDQVSARINVLAAAAPTSQSAGSAAWTGAGLGTVTEQVYPHCAVLSYNHTPAQLSTVEQWTFTTTAVSTGSYTFNWTYDGLHSWFMAHEALEAFADGPTGTTTITLVADMNGNTGNGFSHAGTATLPLHAGYNWGVRPSGGNYDSSRILLGTVRVFDP